jgi:hypothetical protein
MSTSNRAALIGKLQRVLKRTYKYTPTRGEQPLLESLLFACCLENARHDVARQALARLRDSFFDWNEIRVSTVKELAESLSALPEPAAAAARLKSILQAVFESDYSFDLEHLKKQNIGAAVKKLQKLPGTTPFGVAYATQMALGGHAIPLDKGTLGAMVVLGVSTAAEADNGTVPGLERAIPKSKGQEFGALVHELGADFFANPYSPSLRELLVSIAPDSKERFPKRSAKKASPAPEPPAVAKAAEAGKKKVRETTAGRDKRTSAKSSEKRGPRAPKATAETKKQLAGRSKKTAAKSLAKRKPR